MLVWCCLTCLARSREYKIANMRKEVERIQAKEKVEGGLTQGQASTVVRTCACV